MPPKKLNKKKQTKKTVKKQIPKKNVPKRTQQQKPKDTQTHTQNVYINTQRQQRAQSSVPRRSHSTISTPIIVPFVQPLPPGHPFNNNAPQNQSGVSAHVPVNPSVPQPSTLATHVGATPPAHPTTPHNPAPMGFTYLMNTPLKLKTNDPIPNPKDIQADLHRYKPKDLKIMAHAHGYIVPDTRKKEVVLDAIVKQIK